MHAIPAARYLARRKRQNLLLGLLALVALCMLLLGVSVGNGVCAFPWGSLNTSWRSLFACAFPECSWGRWWEPDLP